MESPSGRPGRTAPLLLSFGCFLSFLLPAASARPMSGFWSSWAVVFFGVPAAGYALAGAALLLLALRPAGRAVERCARAALLVSLALAVVWGVDLAAPFFLLSPMQLYSVPEVPVYLASVAGAFAFVLRAATSERGAIRLPLIPAAQSAAAWALRFLIHVRDPYQPAPRPGPLALALFVAALALWADGARGDVRSDGADVTPAEEE